MPSSKPNLVDLEYMMRQLRSKTDLEHVRQLKSKTGVIAGYPLYGIPLG